MRNPLTPYNDAAGHRNTDTSIAAAALIDKSLPRLQRSVMEVVAAARENGVTSDEIADILGWDKHRVRPRTSELRGTRRIAIPAAAVSVVPA